MFDGKLFVFSFTFCPKAQWDVLVKTVVDLLRRNPHLNPVSREFRSCTNTTYKLHFLTLIFSRHFNLLDFYSERFTPTFACDCTHGNNYTEEYWKCCYSLKRVHSPDSYWALPGSPSWFFSLAICFQAINIKVWKKIWSRGAEEAQGGDRIMREWINVKVVLL